VKKGQRGIEKVKAKSTNLATSQASKEMKPSPSHQLAAPIARVLAVDDLLGKVYASCSSPSDRRAFRHATAACYRSPSINAQIFAYVNPPGGLDIDITAALAAFPRHAQLKALFLRNPAPSFKELFKRLLLCNDECASRARTTLRSVVTLSLLGYSCVGSFEATAVALLFPGLQDPDRASCLELRFREDPSDSFLSIAAGQVTPRSLELSSFSGSLQPLASMQQLQCLVMNEPTREQLQSLSESLHHLPQLFTLSLKSYDEHSLVTTRIASTSLRIIDLGCVHLGFPKLDAADLPALQQVYLHGINLSSFPEDVAPADAFSKACFLATWLSALPLRLSEVGREGCFKFEADGRWSRELLESIFFHALTPLRPFLATVTKLETIELGVCEQGMLSCLTDVFSNLIWWEMINSYMEDPLEIWPVLQKLPKLQFLAIDILCAPPKDLLAALKWAADEGRRLRLEFLVLDNHGNEDDWYDRLTFLANQVCSAGFKLLGPLVELVVRRG